MKTRAIPILVTLFAVLGTPAQAQIPTRPTPIREAVKTTIPAATLATLTELHHAGDWKKLQTTALDALRQIDFDHPAWPAEPADSHVLLLWVGKDAAGDPALLWCFVHDPSPAPFSTTLPGLKGNAPRRTLYEVYLSPSPGASFDSHYTSTRVDDPLLAQLPAVAEKFAASMFGLLGGLAGVVPTAQLLPPGDIPPTATLFAWVRRVPLPLARAAIKAHFASAEPISSEDFKKAAEKLANRLRLTDVAHSPCARELAGNMQRVVVEVSEASCPVLARNMGEAEEAFQERKKTAADECRKKLDERLTAEYESSVKMCGTPQLASTLVTVNTEFRKLVFVSGPDKYRADVSLTNRPRDHFSFGLLSSMIFDGKLDEPRVKIDGGNVALNPLPRALTAAVLNVSLVGQDDDAGLSLGERIHGFAGATLSPEFGLTGGVNVFIVRGLGFNIGYARLFYATKKDTDEFGEAPADRTDPFRGANSGVWFAGFSYNFK